MKRGEKRRWDKEGKEELMESVRRAKGRKHWHLATVFPPMDASWGVIMVFRDVNALITTINGNNGNGTVPLHTHMLYREGTEYQFKGEMYKADGIHWSGKRKEIAKER